MNKFQELLVASLIAAVATGAIAGMVIWKTMATQHEFVARQFEAQNSKIQTVGDELAKTAGDLKRLDGALKTTEATLRQVKDQVSLVGTRTGMAQLNSLIEAANKTLAEIKQATAPDQTKAALAPLGAQVGAANKTLAALRAKLDDKSSDKAREEALAQVNSKLDDALKTLAVIGKTADALKGSSTDMAKLDEAAKSMAAIKESLNSIKSRADADTVKLDAASKSLAALDTSIKQGFADVASKQAGVMKAVTKPTPTPSQPAAPKQDLVVFYVSMAGKAAAPAPGLTLPAPPPLAVQYEEIGGVDDEGQAKVIVGKLRGIVKGHSGCTIAVAGHADTLGSDKANYELSRERAEKIADQLKSAFAGDNIAIARTQWGERRLKEWTPDGTAREANRRVEIAVNCEK